MNKSTETKKARCAEIKRKTAETQISVKLNLDGEGKSDIATGIGFLDHMLTLLAKHSFMDLTVKAKGDLEVDSHHTVEDIGIVLGEALREALGDKAGIHRYGNCFIPMDETLAQACLDFSGRPFLVFGAEIPKIQLGNYDTEMTEEFFRAVAVHCGLTLHIRVLYGSNVHHIIEAIFKAFARAVAEATAVDPRVKGVMSSKGVL
jgi:imidazoleglycerol-phosphate dehydratase